MKKISVREAKAYLSHMFEKLSSGKLTLAEAKSQISRLAEHLGEEIIITQDGEAIAKLVPVVDD